MPTACRPRGMPSRHLGDRSLASAVERTAPMWDSSECCSQTQIHLLPSQLPTWGPMSTAESWNNGYDQLLPVLGQNNNNKDSRQASTLVVVCGVGSGIQGSTPSGLSNHHKHFSRRPFLPRSDKNVIKHLPDTSRKNSNTCRPANRGPLYTPSSV